MADIAMCLNHDCPSKKKCYRYMAIPNAIAQSYGVFWVEQGKRKCNDFWPIKGHNIPHVNIRSLK